MFLKKKTQKTKKPRNFKNKIEFCFIYKKEDVIWKNIVGEEMSGRGLDPEFSMRKVKTSGNEGGIIF